MYTWHNTDGSVRCKTQTLKEMRYQIDQRIQRLVFGDNKMVLGAHPTVQRGGKTYDILIDIKLRAK